MRTGEWIMIFATILGPILAVQVQKWLERWRSARDRKIEVFTKLMTSRAAPLSVQHVEALNQIDLEFYGDRKYKKVTEAWKALHDHFGEKTPEGESHNVAWVNKKTDLLVELLYEMGKSLGYDFDKVHIKRATYFPKGYGDYEQDQLVIRQSLVKLFKGELELPMKVVEFPEMEETDLQKALGKAVIDVMNKVGAPEAAIAEISPKPKEDGRVPVQADTRFSGKN